MVGSRGEHISSQVHQASRKLLKTDHLVNQDMRTYFKLEAFGKQYILNVSSSTHFLHDNLPVVEYIGADGLSRTKKLNHSKQCFHEGHVEVMRESGDAEQENAITDGWVAMSSCSGLVSAP